MPRSTGLRRTRHGPSPVERPAFPPSGRAELHRQAVHAIAQAGRLRPVVEDVAEMAAAVRAVDFLARIAELVIGLARDRPGKRTVEAGPAGAAVELGLARIERVAATRANERALALFLVERRTERPLRVLLAQDGIARGRQPALPFRLGIGNLVGLGLGGAAARGEDRKGDARAKPGESRTAIGRVSHGRTL